MENAYISPGRHLRQANLQIAIQFRKKGVYT